MSTQAYTTVVIGSGKRMSGRMTSLLVLEGRDCTQQYSIVTTNPSVAIKRTIYIIYKLHLYTPGCHKKGQKNSALNGR